MADSDTSDDADVPTEPASRVAVFPRGELVWDSDEDRKRRMVGQQHLNERDRKNKKRKMDCDDELGFDSSPREHCKPAAATLTTAADNQVVVAPMPTLHQLLVALDENGKSIRRLQEAFESLESAFKQLQQDVQDCKKVFVQNQSSARATPMRDQEGPSASHDTLPKVSNVSSFRMSSSVLEPKDNSSTCKENGTSKCDCDRGPNLPQDWCVGIIVAAVPITLRQESSSTDQWWQALGSDIREWSYILIPHCTLDWHLEHAVESTGCSSSGEREYHRGGVNMEAVMNWVLTQFATPGLDAMTTTSGGRVGGCRDIEDSSSTAPVLFASPAANVLPASESSMLVLMEGSSSWNIAIGQALKPPCEVNGMQD
eukprot:scaffold3821_cov127-Cylindrotheca_fusiformis.AAC.2